MRRTSETEAGQIYLPTVNLLLMVGVILLVGIFKNSGALQDAYGLAVTGTMSVTTALTAGALDTRGRSSATAKMPVPTLLVICGMSVNSPWPPPTVEFGSVNTSDISGLKLAQCYFNGTLGPLHPTAPQINGISGPFTTPAAGQRIARLSARVAG